MNEIGLYFQSKTTYTTVPEWSQFLINLGRLSSQLSQSAKRKTRIGVALPTQSFAAAFVAVGVVLDASQRMKSTSVVDHFEALLRLKRGSRVRILEGDACRIGTIAGQEGEGDSRRIKVRISKGRKSCGFEWFYFGNCDGIQPVDESSTNGMAKRKRHKLSKNEIFASTLLGIDNISDFGMVSTSDCLVVTQSNRFEREVKEQFLAVRDEGGFHRGCLQDVIRVKEYLPGGHAYHTSVLTSKEMLEREFDWGKPATITVFDGALCFLKTSHLIVDSSWILLLDKSAPCTNDAVNIFMQEYLKRTGDIDSDLPKAPKGVEILGFLR